MFRLLYLRNGNLPKEGLSNNKEFEIGDVPSSVSKIRMKNEIKPIIAYAKDIFNTNADVVIC